MSASVPPDRSRVGTHLTARLRLEIPSGADLADLIRLWQDPLVTATLGGPRNPDAVQGLLDAMITHRAQHGWGWWILRDRETGDFLGYGGIRRATFDELPEIELGYALVAPVWGRGLASELATDAVQVAFEDLRHDSVVAITTPANAASRRVMEKAGMQYEKHVQHAGEPHVLYRAAADRWRPPQIRPGA
jgi:ribosomal-protein-alanine N-acetyltransferase